MTGVLRMFWVWLTYRRRGRLKLLETSVTPMRVMPNDLDLNFHMNNARYFSLADVGRFDWWLRTGMWNAAIRRGWRPVAGDSNARYSRSLQCFQRYDLNCRLLGWDEKWMFQEQRFISGGQVMATVVVRYLFLNKAMKPVVPAAVLEKMGYTETSPELPGWVQTWHRAQNQLSASLRSSRTPQ